MADKIELYRKGRMPRTIDELFDDMQRSFEDMMTPLFGETWPSLRTGGMSFGKMPFADIEETDSAYTVTAELPGIPRENIEVKVSEDNTVEISGKASTDKKESKGSYVRQERSHTDFYRRFRLESDIDSDKVEAKVENGILSLTLPKKAPESAKIKKVEIK